MANIVDYVKKTGKFSFEEKPFSIEDALVLAEFCYLKFDGIIGGQNSERVSLKDIDNREDKENLFSIKSYAKDNRKLYNAIVDSDRFNKMEIGYYVNHVDIVSETQFAAVTFFLPEDIVYIAYRGTDETIAGWQEDFALALKKPIIGQTLSAAYINDISDKINKNFYVGGHSKGGNLAMYAAMCAKDSAQDRILKIFSFDGPGFRPEFLDEGEYNDIRERLVRIMPKSSPVGLVFNAPGECEVIEAKSVGVLQHNPYNWIIKGEKLVRTQMTEQHLLSARTMNEWLLSLDDEGINDFVTLLCWLLDATDATTTEELKQDMPGHVKALMKAGSELDDKTKEMASFFVKSYFELAGGMVKDEVNLRYEAFLSEINKKKEEVSNGMKVKTEEVMNLFEETKGKIEVSFAETKGKLGENKSKKKKKTE